MDTLNQIGVFMGIGSLVVVAGGYFTYVGKKGRADIIRQDNDDLRKSQDQMRSDKKADEATIKQQAQTIKILENKVTQTPAVTQLIDLIGKQQEQTQLQHNEVIAKFTDLTSSITELATAINNNLGDKKL